MLKGHTQDFCLWRYLVLGHLNKSRFGMVVDAAEVVMAICSGAMSCFMDKFKPVEVNQDVLGKTQVLFFECDSEEQFDTVISAAKEIGLTSATRWKSIIDFAKEKERRNK
jgi:hypothetical protein